MAQVCPKCRAQVSEYSLNCPSCGSELESGRTILPPQFPSRPVPTAGPDPAPPADHTAEVSADDNRQDEEEHLWMVAGQEYELDGCQNQRDDDCDPYRSSNPGRHTLNYAITFALGRHEVAPT